MLLEQLITGGSISRFTVTSKQHHWGAAPATVFVQQTVLVPGGKKLPEGGEQGRRKVAPVQVSIPYAAYVTGAPFGPPQSTVMLLGQSSLRHSPGQRPETVTVN